MRALYRDRRLSGEVNGDLVTVSAVTMPTDKSAMRDVFFRFTSAAASTSCSYTVHKTRADARANSTAIASGTFSLGYAGQLAVVNNPSNPPTMTGMVITVDTSDATNEEILVIWGYSASPDVELCEDYAELLAEYTGAGEALERYAGTIQAQTVGEIHRAATLYVKTEAYDAAPNFDTRELRGRDLTIRFQLLLAGLERGDAAGLYEEMERRLRQDLAAVESIVLDERRTMDGKTDLLRKVSWAGVDMPAPAAPPFHGYMIAALQVRVTIYGFRANYAGE